MKYQFCIRFNNIDVNSAASKAVLDCNKIFSKNGYQDYTFTVGDNSRKLPYYFSLLNQLLVFVLSVKKRSIVGIQYPLLSVNKLFPKIISLLKLKHVKFFCVVHDLESLRTGGKDPGLIKEEVANLNCYDTVIVHNEFMQKWLAEAGVTSRMIPLQLFDYLGADFIPDNVISPGREIVYAGNLSKSTFIYDLPELKNCRFNVYGPGFRHTETPELNNLHWRGVYGPDDVPKHLHGNFGLIWDGTSIDKCDEILGNYLKYNNPHKCSLYIAAGLPVIAPADSAIGVLITKMNIGFLVDNLHELESINIDEEVYTTMKNNVLTVREKLLKGGFFSHAIATFENTLNDD